MGPVATPAPAEPEAAAPQPVATAIAAGPVAHVLALQRSAGNAAVVSRLRPEPRAHLAPRAPDPGVEQRGSRALQESATARRSLARYAHQDCKEEDLKAHIWPSDALAREMVKKAIKALSAKSIDPSVSALLARYFMTSSPNLGSILKIFDKLDAEFRANDYTYECEDDEKNDRCKRVPDSSTMAKAAHGYTWGTFLGAITQAHIHLCMNTVSGQDNDCVASTIIHEMSHRYAGTEDHAYCNFCDEQECPKELSASDALDNADSFSAFAYKLWRITLT